MSETSSAGYGQQRPTDSNDEFNAISFMARQIVERLNTMKPVKVVAVHPGSGSPPATGTVDVLPLVNQVDGNNNATPHGVVYGLQFLRLQSGLGAVISDPQVDDIGFVVCADRDISNVTRTRAQANPGSGRKYDLADGIYIGGILNDVPTQYVWFSATGLKIADSNGNVLEMSSSGITFTGNVKVTNISASGTVIAGFGTGDQVNLQTHVHPTAATGAPSPPTPGT